MYREISVSYIIEILYLIAIEQNPAVQTMIFLSSMNFLCILMKF